MTKLEALKQEIVNRIAHSHNEVFMRRDFSDIASYQQVGHILGQLTDRGSLMRIGYGLYARTAISPLSNKIVPRKSLRELAAEVLARLGIEVFPSTHDQAYNEGRTTQVPTGRVIGVRGHIARKIGYDGKYITFEYFN